MSWGWIPAQASKISSDRSWCMTRHWSRSGDGSASLREVRDGEVCPFKGLASFGRADADYFSGREAAVSDLVARAAEGSLVGIVGPSGIGKSSLLCAGALAALSGGGLPGSDSWRQVLMRPGDHPCAELTRSLGGEEIDATLAGLAPGERLVVAVDQLEEVFTVCRDEQERDAFLECLVRAAGDPQRRGLVFVSLRADFYGGLASHARFARCFSNNHALIGPMNHDGARASDRAAGGARRAGHRAWRWCRRSWMTWRASPVDCRCSRRLCFSCGACGTGA